MKLYPFKHKPKWPKDFTRSKASKCDDEEVNQLIKDALTSDGPCQFASTGDTLVMITFGRADIYKLRFYEKRRIENCKCMDDTREDEEMEEREEGEEDE